MTWPLAGQRETEDECAIVERRWGRLILRPHRLHVVLVPDHAGVEDEPLASVEGARVGVLFGDQQDV
jgi:hypothetical protein